LKPITFFDLILTPIYIGIIFFIAKLLRPKLTNAVTQKYYYPALTVKLVGAIALGLIYQFYYTGGDTFRYFYNARVIWESLDDSFLTTVRLLVTRPIGEIGPITKYTYRMDTITDGGTYFVTQVAAILGFISFKTYTVIGCFFALLSFIGMFLLFDTFVKIIPSLHKEFAISVLFMPSVFFWGSGVLKDTLCMGALGLLFFGFYRGFVEKKKLIPSLIIFGIGFFIILKVKVYIILCFMPVLVLWLFMQYSANIKSTFVKIFLAPILIVIGLGASFFLMTKLTEGDALYSLDNIGERAKITADYLHSVSEESGGSTYYIGKLDGSIASMLALTPQAIVVTLFRPFIWEVKNPVMLLSAIESTWFIFLTVSILLKSGLIKPIRTISQQPILVLCFLFSFAFSIAVGVTSNNFGTLVRYKIPVMPFYLAGLYILGAKLNQKKKAKVNLGIPR
jgi:hypothetical protein